LKTAFAAESARDAEEQSKTVPALRYETPATARERFITWLTWLRDCAAAKGTKRRLTNDLTLRDALKHDWKNSPTNSSRGPASHFQ